MLARRLIQKATNHFQNSPQHGTNVRSYLNFEVYIHHGVPSASSLLAFDPVQGLLAIGTLDGRIKVIGANNIEGLFVSPNKLPYKFIEFLENKGVLIGISSGNIVEAWDLETRRLSSFLEWGSIITSFSVITGSIFMYIGNEEGTIFVVKYDKDAQRLVKVSYHAPTASINESVTIPGFGHEPVVGVLPHPCSSGNRLLLVYESGLLLLWDILESRSVNTNSDKNLKIKYGILSTAGNDAIPLEAAPLLAETEITSACWASYDGSVVAVGYVDGDILFWDMMSVESPGIQQSDMTANVVRLQLATSERRLPVIILYWFEIDSSNDHTRGSLFVYGGDEVCSIEKLTVLHLQWSPGMETFSCVGHVNLVLTGSFSDMRLLRTDGGLRSNDDVPLFVLTSPGNLRVYDFSSLTALASQLEGMNTSTQEFPSVVPTANPLITVIKLCSFVNCAKLMDSLSEASSSDKKPSVFERMKWALTGAVQCKTSSSMDGVDCLLMVAGYEDGSFRLWIVANLILELACVLQRKMENVGVDGVGSSVSAIDVCCGTSCFSIGNDHGLVLVYDMGENPVEKQLHIITGTRHEVKSVHGDASNDGISCRAVVSFRSSRVQSLRFIFRGGSLAIEYGSCEIAVLEMKSLSLRYMIDSVHGSPTRAISVLWCSRESGSTDGAAGDVLVLMEDATITVSDGCTGDIIQRHVLQESLPSVSATARPLSMFITGVKHTDALLLICLTDCLCLYDVKRMIEEGCCQMVERVELEGTCSWVSSILRRRNAEECRELILLYENGDLELRDVRGFGLVKKSSLMSMLRWNVTPQLIRMMSCTEDGQMVLVNGREVAFVCFGESAWQRCCLYDRSMAEEDDDALEKTGKKNKEKACVSHQPTATPVIELNIDDVEIDEEPDPSSSSSRVINPVKRGNEFTKPRMRTPQEIIATYRKTGDSSSAAAHARDRLVQRQEKLESIQERSEELRSGAEDFASMARELSKTMQQRRKWWKL